MLIVCIKTIFYENAKHVVQRPAAYSMQIILSPSTSVSLQLAVHSVNVQLIQLLCVLIAA